MSPVAVLGAGGPTGSECVKRLLELGKEVKAVVRDPAKYEGKFPEAGGLQMAKGDVSDPESLRQALAGCDGVIFAASGRGYWSAKPVDCEGVRNVAAAVHEAGTRGRVVLVSSALVTPQNRWNPIRILLNNIRWGLMDAKYQGEQLLRASGVDYCVVRPGGLTNDPAGQAQLLTKQGDTSAGRVSRADVAAACVAALTDPAAKRTTLELASAPAEGGPAPLDAQLEGLFKGLQPDAAA